MFLYDSRTREDERVVRSQIEIAAIDGSNCHST